jgi:hypothetical protein
LIDDLVPRIADQPDDLLARKLRVIAGVGIVDERDFDGRLLRLSDMGQILKSDAMARTQISYQEIQLRCSRKTDRSTACRLPLRAAEHDSSSCLGFETAVFSGDSEDKQ